jgi:hypothetical protein
MVRRGVSGSSPEEGLKGAHGSRRANREGTSAENCHFRDPVFAASLACPPTTQSVSKGGFPARRGRGDALASYRRAASMARSTGAGQEAARADQQHVLPFSVVDVRLRRRPVRVRRLRDSDRVGARPPASRRRDPAIRLIRPPRPSGQTSAAASAAAGDRRPLRTPRRRASGSSYARAHAASRRPPAH